MSCYHPLIAMPSGELTLNGKKKYGILRLTKEDTVEDIKKLGASFIPCGHCIGCRLDYSRSWADRMMLELETSKKALFVTLTYNNDNLPIINDNVNGDEVATLNKRDLQLFMKRLRKHFDDIRIRFYAAGEYGPKTFRPHYHIILFGICIDDLRDISVHGVNELGDKFYISPEIDNAWRKGYSLVSDVSWKTCAYVARYVVKKVNGQLKELRDGSSGRLTEFAVMSRKPGIGGDYLKSHMDCLDMANINISTYEGGLKINIPKYYLNKLELINKEKFDKIKEERKRFSNDSLLLELKKTDLSVEEYLEVEEANKYAQLRALKREKVR